MEGEDGDDDEYVERKAGGGGASASAGPLRRANPYPAGLSDKRADQLTNEQLEERLVIVGQRIADQEGDKAHTLT